MSDDPDLTPDHQANASFHERVSDIVAEALEREGDARRVYIAAACGDDEALRSEVEDLIEEAVETRFLETPAAARLAGPRLLPTEAVPAKPAPTRSLPATPVAGRSRIGRYRIKGRLGEGGMGTVYLAEQDEPVHRRVALKVIRALTANAHDRFAAECQALARLNHPNVAAMYDVGATKSATADGVEHPYVAMEWVEGEDIVTWCEARRADVETRLRLVLGVCAGIRHAHEKGVLHCDLKPSNVLVTEVDGRAVAKVIDFGIARALDEPLFGDGNLTGELFLGSPMYTSPEAASPHGRKHLDSRSDVYALGLILFELLVGKVPFDTRQLQAPDLFKQLREREAVAPSVRLAALEPELARSLAEARDTTPRRLARALRGDLDAVVLKATAHAPADRYGSPGGLAADLRRHLHHAPVAARGNVPAYLAGRFVRRNLSAVASIVLLLVALTGGFLARTLEARRANAEAERARLALTESEQVRDFMIELFEAADPEPAASERLTVRELLAQGAERLDDELEGQPVIRARFLQTIGTIYTKLGLFPAAEELIAEALDLRASALGESHHETLESRSELGVIRRRLGRLEEAADLLEAVLAARLADSGVDAELVAQSHNNLGNLYWSQERYDESERAHRAALAIREADPDTRANEAVSANNLGVLLMSQRRSAEARPFLERAAKLWTLEHGTNHARVANALNNLGLAEQDLDTWANAEGRFRDAVAIWEASLGSDHQRTLRGRRNLVIELLRKHRWDEAVAEARAIAEVAGSSDDDPVTRVRVLRLQGRAERLAGAIREAIATLLRALKLAETALDAEHPDTSHVRTSLALAWSDAGRHAEAAGLLDKIAEIQDRTLAPDHRSRIRTEESLGEVALEAGRFAAAEAHFRRVLDSRRRRFGDHNRWTADAYHQLGRALGALGRDDEATQVFLNALDALQDIFGPEHPAVGDNAHELALIELRRGNEERARALVEQAITVRRAHYPPDDADLRASVELLASL